MDEKIRKRAEAWSRECKAEREDLLRDLGRVPAPTRQEDQRAAYVRNWLLEQGAADVIIDDAKNVICRLGPADAEDLVVFAAHTDIVFPSVETLPMHEENGKLYAPGIGDDTANLVNLLMGAKYLIENEVQLTCGVLVVANSCEEGLGNSDGMKAIFSTYGTRVREFYSFDAYQPLCCATAIGSHRYRVTCTTTGGHSYANFGQPNAIHLLCGLVEELYRVDLPTHGHTTYNVGRIEGGTSVNTIAQDASMLYEFRSTEQSCLDEMDEKFRRCVEHWRGRGGELEVELLGVRPSNGPVDANELAAFTERGADAVRTFWGREPDFTPNSTDSNIPLSLGIPANTIGTIDGALAHTREEWVDLESLGAGTAIVTSLMLGYEA